MFELQLGRFGRAMAAYERGVSPTAPRFGPPALTATGAVSLLWRALLSGYPAAGLPWGPARDYAAAGSKLDAAELGWRGAALDFPGRLALARLREGAPTALDGGGAHSPLESRPESR